MHFIFSKSNWHYSRFFFWTKVFKNRRELHTSRERHSIQRVVKIVKVRHASLLPFQHWGKTIQKHFYPETWGIINHFSISIKISFKKSFSLNINNELDAGISEIYIRTAEDATNSPVFCNPKNCQLSILIKIISYYIWTSSQCCEHTLFWKV